MVPSSFYFSRLYRFVITKKRGFFFKFLALKKIMAILVFFQLIIVNILS